MSGFPLQTRKDHPPMTAAERKRACRARGNRSYRPTEAHLEAARRRNAEQLAGVAAVPAVLRVPTWHEGAD